LDASSAIPEFTAPQAPFILALMRAAWSHCCLLAQLSMSDLSEGGSRIAQAQRSASGFFFILAANSTILRIASARDGTSICPRRQSSTVRKKGSSHGGILKPPTSSGVAMVDAASLRPRARQNVIGEMFWFAGKLGRDRVCALVKGHIEMPSDFAGVGYTDMDDRGAWKAELLKELAAAGYTVNWAKALA